MSSISIAVGDSSVCKYVVVDLLTFVSGNYDVCDNDVFGAKTRSICLRSLVASVCTLLLDRGDDCLKEFRHLVCCRLYDNQLFNQRQKNEQAV